MPAPELLIKNVQHHGGRKDLYVGGGEIIELVPTGFGSVPDNVEIIEADGLVLLPGLTDCHVHLREPGFEYKENIASGLKTAAHGGFSNIMCMANTLPVNDNATVTELILDKARTSCPNGPRLFPIGALTKGLQGKELAPMVELAQAGCAAFSNDGLPVKDTEIFRRAMEYASDTGKVVIDHCEDPFLAPGAGMNEGAVSSRMGIPAQPDMAEAGQVARDILLAEYLNLPIHLAHVSCEKSVALIAWAKDRGVKVTAETCPHFLILTEDYLENPETLYDTNAKVNPPLRTEADRLAVIKALNEGIIDCLATDHAPHAAHEKEVEFDQAPCGITGLDTALSTTWTMVESGELEYSAFIRAWTTAPCSIFDLPVNTFVPGDPADFILVDPDLEWEVSPSTLFSKGKNTPLLGNKLRGRVVNHFLRGKKVV